LIASVALIALAAIVVYGFMKSSFYLGISLFLIEIFVHWYLPAGIELGQVGPFSVYLADLILASGTLIFAQNFPRMANHLGARAYLLVTLYAIALIGLGRGTAIFGIQQAINEGREALLVLSAICWVSYVTVAIRPSTEGLRKTVLTGMIIVLVLGAINVSLYGLAGANEFVVLSDGFQQIKRPLMQVQAIFLVASVPILLYPNQLSRDAKRFTLLVAFASTAGVLISQQRSSIVACSIVLILMLFIARVRAFVVSIFLTIGAIVAVFLTTPRAFQSISNTFETSFTDQSTLNARSGSWQQYIDNFFHEDLLNQLIGVPFGNGWGRYDGGGALWVEFNPHNWYIILILRFGIIGLLAFLAFYFANLVKTVSSGEPALLRSLPQIGILVYQFFYASPWQVLPFAYVEAATEGKKASVPKVRTARAKRTQNS
jgi:hypothetical protein